MDNATDNELIERMRDGDTSALGFLYMRYSGAVKGFASKFIEVRDEVDDINHQIFISLWENRDKIRDVNALKTYLFMMTRNTILKIYRHRRIVREYESESKSLNADLAPNLEAKVDTADIVAMIKLKVSEMPELQRRSFCMSRFEYKTYAEIAEELGISVKMVQYYITKTMKELRPLIQSIMVLISIDITQHI